MGINTENCYIFQLTELREGIMENEFDKVKQIICDMLDVEAALVTGDASVIDDLGAGSIDSIELIMALENEFGIDIPEEDAEKLVTVDDIVKYIKSKI